jgi:hypothetical protein
LDGVWTASVIFYSPSGTYVENRLPIAGKSVNQKQGLRMSEQQNQPILNEMPSVIMALFLLVVGIEGFIVLGEQGMLGNRYGLGMRYGLINQFGLFPAALNTQIETGVFSWFELKRYISFTFIHGSSVGTAISCALLLAMGKFVGSVFSNVATLIVFIGSAIGA